MESEGIELNPSTRNIAIQKTGRPVYDLSADELFKTGARYDAITLTDVLEHIPNPVAVLTDLRKLLNAGGVISIKVPCGINQLKKEKVRKSLGITNRVEIATNLCHINHFSPIALKRALTSRAFRMCGSPLALLNFHRTKSSCNAKPYVKAIDL